MQTPNESWDASGGSAFRKSIGAAVGVEPGVTMADELSSVAVHNAYHLGKIVALRQRIGAWPPAAASGGT